MVISHSDSGPNKSRHSSMSSTPPPDIQPNITQVVIKERANGIDSVVHYFCLCLNGVIGYKSLMV